MTKEIDLSNLLTVVINTKNRPRLLNASLNYIRDSCLNAQIIVTDASPAEVWEINDKSINSILPKSQTLHIKPINGEQFPSIIEGLSQVKTPYSIVSGDDDFFIVDGIKSCVYFLEQNPSFSACMGKIMQFVGIWDKSVQKWTFKSFRDLTPRQIDNDNISKRLSKYADNIEISSYAVHRTEVIRSAYTGALDYGFSEDNSLPELALNSYTLIKGSLGTVNTFFHMWFSPNKKRTDMASTLYSGNNSLNWFDKMFSEQYITNMNAFINFLMLNVSNKNKNEMDTIKNIIQSIWGKFYFKASLRRIEEIIDNNIIDRKQKKVIVKILNYIINQSNSNPFKELYQFFRIGIRFGYIQYPLHKYHSDFITFKKNVTKSMTDKSLIPKKIKCQY